MVYGNPQDRAVLSAVIDVDQVVVTARLDLDQRRWPTSGLRL